MLNGKSCKTGHQTTMMFTWVRRRYLIWLHRKPQKSTTSSSISWTEDQLTIPRLGAQFWQYVEDKEKPRLCQLIISCVLRGLGGWVHRVMNSVTSLDMLLLRMLESEPWEEDEARVHVAQVITCTEDCCFDNPYADFALKVKRLWRAELFQIISSNGKCPVSFFPFRLEIPAST